MISPIKNIQNEDPLGDISSCIRYMVGFELNLINCLLKSFEGMAFVSGFKSKNLHDATTNEIVNIRERMFLPPGVDEGPRPSNLRPRMKRPPRVNKVPLPGKMRPRMLDKNMIRYSPEIPVNNNHIRDQMIRPFVFDRIVNKFPELKKSFHINRDGYSCNRAFCRYECYIFSSLFFFK